MVLQGTHVVEIFYFSKNFTEKPAMIACVATTVHLVPTTLCYKHLFSEHLTMQVWTRPELKVTEQWNPYYFLSVPNILCGHCQVLLSGRI